MMTVRTPATTLVRSVTVNTWRCTTRLPSSLVDPLNQSCVPGRSGNHLLSTSVDREKFLASKSVAVTSLAGTASASTFGCELLAQADAASSRAAATAVAAPRRSSRRCGDSTSASPEAQRERGDDEQVDDRRGDEPAENHDRERVLDLMTGDAAGDDERQERQRRCQRGHQDRRQPLLRAPQDERTPEGLALVAFEMLEVADHEDAVSRRDA